MNTAHSKRGALAAVVAAALFVTGCGSDGGGEAESIEFWTQIYGDPTVWREAMEGLGADYEEETGTAVNIEFMDFASSRDRWLLVAQGADAPDVGDLYQLHTNVQLGGGKAGPVPITEYREEYWPDLTDRFFESTLVDVEWENEFYGIPWRADIRTTVYRTDLFEEAGLAGPPTTWDEVTEYAEQLTDTDQQKFGLVFGSGPLVQSLIPYYWQAGGEYMTPDGKTATLDTPEMREALEWMSDLVQGGFVPPEFMDPNYDPLSDFRTGRAAIIMQASSDDIESIQRDNPELDGKWAVAEPPQGPDNSAAYSGSGYWGLLYGTDKVEESLEWIHFLSQDENMQTISEATGLMSTNRSVMKSEKWTAEERHETLTTVLAEDAHTSQAPSPFWTIIRDEKPGAVLWDLFQGVLVNDRSVDEALAEAETEMQAILDRGAR